MDDLVQSGGTLIECQVKELSVTYFSIPCIVTIDDLQYFLVFGVPTFMP